ncbi:hypothetical protein [Brochothrix thermosphacta]|uniref:hypothetical protein n=1 Tax=Brochothrix thermosphacta TaxID=2756 RepID=UPI00265CC33F|nr:hypothetical protein [Brochothrix thermosphacta]WKK68322.1 hypothetical protein Q0G00_08340 [Brochothrix thermosphacta]
MPKLWNEHATLNLTNAELAYIYEMLSNTDAYNDSDARLQLIHQQVDTSQLDSIETYNRLGEYLDEL